MTDCPFCRRVASGDVTVANHLAVALPDAFPLTPGHMLVLPKRHEADFFGLSDAELAAILELVRRVREESDAPGCNVGVNVGEVAGQTIGHTHVHVIPRLPGDVPDPRGGIRWIIPGRAPYWE